MPVIIKDIEKGSPADKSGIKPGDTLVSVDGNSIMDVLDYRFYQDNEILTVEIISDDGKLKKIAVEKDEYEELGLIFETYLMDEKRSCMNKCVFCFIDQLPKGLRESLYFKDDDSRLSFLFGNYITLTNITEHEIRRIISMHISPVNISVHTTNPELRVKMMTNKNAGKALDTIYRFNDAGIKMNCQLVLCPGYNDGKELEKTLFDLTQLENIECIAAVPVGLTKYRDGLTELSSFDKQSAGEVLDIIDTFGNKCTEKYGERRCYGADEFYLLSEREIPNVEFYGDFLQLENGVGLWSLLKSEAEDAVSEIDCKPKKRTVSLATGVAAYPLISHIASLCAEKCPWLNCRVYRIVNNFFGEKITVSGLITATDLIDQLKGEDLGEELLLPSSMLRSEGDMFLDSITLDELSQNLGISIRTTDNDGFELVNKIIGEE